MSCGRVVARCLVLLTRLVLSAFMTTQGTQFLVAEIGMGELLLNAVALEFVLLTDELLYAALAPLRVKRVIKNMSGFVGLKYATVYGIDLRTICTLGFICSMLAWAMNSRRESREGERDSNDPVRSQRLPFSHMHKLTFASLNVVLT